VEPPGGIQIWEERVNCLNAREVALVPYRSICPDIVTIKERIRLEDGAAGEAEFGLDGSAGVTGLTCIGLDTVSIGRRRSGGRSWGRGRPTPTAVPGVVWCAIGADIFVRVGIEALSDRFQLDSCIRQESHSTLAHCTDSCRLGLMREGHVRVAGTLGGEAGIKVVALLCGSTGRITRVIGPSYNGPTILHNVLVTWSEEGRKERTVF